MLKSIVKGIRKGSWLKDLLCVSMPSGERKTEKSRYPSSQSCPSADSERRRRRRREASRVRNEHRQHIVAETTPALHVTSSSLDDVQHARPARADGSSSRSSSYYNLHDKPLPPTPPHSGPERLSTGTVNEVLEWLGRNLDHIPYAVCGLAAMVAYGFDGRLPEHVSIVCPSYSKEVIRCWAAAKGMETYRSRPDLFGIPGRNGQTRHVRIKYLDDDSFDDLRTFRLGAAGTPVLAMSALVDGIARAYADTDRDASSRHAGYALDIFWLLESIVGGPPEQRIHDVDVPNVRNPLFFDLFDCTYPGARELFARAGLETGEDDGEDFVRCMKRSSEMQCAKANRPPAAEIDSEEESEEKSADEDFPRFREETREEEDREEEEQGGLRRSDSELSIKTEATVGSMGLWCGRPRADSGPMGGLFRRWSIMDVETWGMRVSMVSCA